jgi:anti-sigma factor RsiW
MRVLFTRVRFVLDHRWAPRRFSAQLDGELPAPERARMARHLGECIECRRAFAGLTAVVEALRHLPPTQPARAPARLAASVLAALGEPPSRTG